MHENNKIGIITIHNSPNYGACLQSFALYHYLQTQGYNCEIIDLARPTHKDYIESEKYTELLKKKKPFLAERILKKIISFSISKIKLKVQKKVNNTEALFFRQQKFDSFNAQIKLSNRFCSIDELYNNPPLYNIYITGSDQVWNPGNIYAVEPFFLTFVMNEGKKISYAPSFGVTSLPYQIKSKYKEWISSYDTLSVREEEGKELLMNLTQKNVEVVLDPVFLLDISYWKSIAKKPDITKKYIFYFSLGNNRSLIKYAQKIKSELGYELIVLTQNLIPIKSSEYQYIVDAGPEEFLGWIVNAEIVFTDSFHASAFSILLAKNFFSFLLPNQRGSRITNLLNIFSLSSHLLNQDLSQKGNELITHQIDREKLLENIIIEQKRSRDYLINAVGF